MKTTDIMLKKILELNAQKVTQTISEDDFPETITPDFLKKAVRDYPLRGGKRLRSALLSWSCGLFGGNPESAKFAAAAVEIYHNWTLVHDDIIDNDLTRRNAPSLHVSLANFAENNYKNGSSVKFGQDFAILAGDIQQGWAVNMMLKSLESGISHKTVIYLIKKLQEQVNRDLISGEALDVEFSYENPANISKEQVEKMLYMKTGVLLEFAAVTGGIIALDKTFPPDISIPDMEALIKNNTQLKNIANFASKAGTAFQLKDDWLGIFGDEKLLGKPIASDIAEAKPTILLLETLDHIDNKEKKQLKSFIGRVSFTPSDIELIKNIIRNSGAEQIVLEKSETLMKDAIKSLDHFKDSQYKTNLNLWADFLLRRKF
jgi:geranylgeranyl diphosphate synthase type I